MCIRDRGKIGLNDLLQVVNGKEVGILDLVNLGVDIAWHGNINEKNRLEPAPFDDIFGILRSDDAVRCAGRRQDDIGTMKVLKERLETDRLTTELFCQTLCP